MQRHPVDLPRANAHRKAVKRWETPGTQSFLWGSVVYFPKVMEAVKQRPAMKVKPHRFGSRQRLGSD